MFLHRSLHAWLIALAASVIALLSAAPAYAQATPSPYTSAVRYDPVGRVTGTIAPDPDGAGLLKYAAVRNSYDPAGRLIKVEQGELAAWQSEAVAPASWSGFTIHRLVETAYDIRGRKVRDTVRSGTATHSVTQYSYDVLGQLECTAVRMNSAVWGSLPASACTQSSGGSDRITRNVYDIAGQRLQVRVGVGSAAVAADATWAYDDNGRVTTVIDANGNRATLSYDRHGRKDRWTLPATSRPSAYNDATQETALATAGAANAADYEEYEYDANGNLLWLKKRDGSVLTFDYDPLNRLEVKVVPPRAGLTAAQTRDVYYEYDLRGLQTKARFDSLVGEGITNQWDGFGRLKSSTLAMASATRTLQYQYDRNGNRTRVTHPDNVYFGYDHDGVDRLKTLAENTTNILTQTYNSAGLRSGLARGGSSSSYVYDGARVTSLGHDLAATSNDVSWTFGYNPASQISSLTRTNDAYAWTGAVAVNRNYTTNGLNQYSEAGTADFCYDANGNLTADGSSVYRYDIENRLVEKRLQTNTNCSALSYAGTLQASLRYDPTGRLFETSGGIAGPTRFLNDGNALVAEYDGNNALLRRYVHGSGIDEPLIWYEGSTVSSSTRRQLSSDWQGSIVAVANSGGALITPNSYDEYGIPGSSNTGRFQYTGQIWIPELAMYHYKARIYSPTLGRFLQTDPIGYDDQFNLYAYVGNDPVNMGDPTGLASCTTGTRVANADALTCSHAYLAQSEDESSRPRHLDGDTAMTRAMSRDAYEYLEEDISEEELKDRNEARAAGSAAAGAAVLGINVAVKSGAGAVIVSGVSSAAKTVPSAVPKFTRKDVVRFGKIVVPGPVAGTSRPVVTRGVAGGGPKSSFKWHYHIHKYNWYKPWTWFKHTPIK